jgi:hypothetical protein
MPVRTIIASRSYHEVYVATYRTEGLTYNTGGSRRDEWQEKTIPNIQATIMERHYLAPENDRWLSPSI